MVDSVLGNHDYMGDAEAQLSPVLREIDSRWLCSRSFIVDSGDALSTLTLKELKQLENRLERGITRIRSKKVRCKCCNNV
ncbi:hypothetical protein JHK87_006416 [Glycine soja]|nr:hypothetical protein JHK87_006416 [Glycine soja]